MTTTYDDFFDALAATESSDNYSMENEHNYLGRYQMGEEALYDVGLINGDKNLRNNDYSGGWTGKYGVSSKTDFLASEAAQDAAIKDYMVKQF